MKKFLNSVAGRYTIFGICLFVVAIGFSFFESYNRIQVAFNDTQISITSNKYSMRVEYDLIESIELMDMPDRGESNGGSDDGSIRFGNWTNETWGDYVSLSIPHATNCVVIHLNDGRTFIFNSRDNDTTAEIYATFQSYLDGSVPAST